MAQKSQRWQLEGRFGMRIGQWSIKPWQTTCQVEGCGLGRRYTPAYAPVRHATCNTCQVDEYASLDSLKRYGLEVPLSRVMPGFYRKSE